jgi:hypothetical protein
LKLIEQCGKCTELKCETTAKGERLKASNLYP